MSLRWCKTRWRRPFSWLAGPDSERCSVPGASSSFLSRKGQQRSISLQYDLPECILCRKLSYDSSSRSALSSDCATGRACPPLTLHQVYFHRNQWSSEEDHALRPRRECLCLAGAAQVFPSFWRVSGRLGSGHGNFWISSLSSTQYKMCVHNVLGFWVCATQRYTSPRRSGRGPSASTGSPLGLHSIVALLGLALELISHSWAALSWPILPWVSFLDNFNNLKFKWDYKSIT